MPVLAAEDAKLAAVFAETGRNDPCPCDSGLKFKKCHGHAETAKVVRVPNGGAPRPPAKE